MTLLYIMIFPLHISQYFWNPKYLSLVLFNDFTDGVRKKKYAQLGRSNKLAQRNEFVMMSLLFTLNM